MHMGMVPGLSKYIMQSLKLGEFAVTDSCIMKDYYLDTKKFMSKSFWAEFQEKLVTCNLIRKKIVSLTT